MQEKLHNIVDEVKKVIRGKDFELSMIMSAILAKGHILIEDIPGVGKTTIAMAFSKAMELDEHRLQFTPDVLPSDVVGFRVLNQTGEFEFKEGVVVCNLFLADEINRTSPKTQSALLEVMEEKRITIDGVSRNMPEPFHVIATQNPVGSIGTQMLPESQMDRFMIRISIGYPENIDEIQLVKERQLENPLNHVRQVISKEELIQLQDKVLHVHIHEQLVEYMVHLVSSTRSHQIGRAHV